MEQKATIEQINKTVDAMLAMLREKATPANIFWHVEVDYYQFSFNTDESPQLYVGIGNNAGKAEFAEIKMTPTPDELDAILRNVENYLNSLETNH